MENDIQQNNYIMCIFSDTFKNSAHVLKILCWTIALGFIAATYSVLLTAIDRQNEKVMGIGICLAFNFFLNLLIIPKFSYHGAAIAKLMTEILHLFIMVYLVSRYLTWIPLDKVFVKPLVTCMLMYFFINFIDQWNLIILIPISVFFYFISLLIMGFYNEKEIDFFKGISLKMYTRLRFSKT